MKNEKLSGMKLTPQELAKTIDHTLLQPYATQADVEMLCEEARGFGFATVFVNPMYVELAVDLLRKSGVKVGTAVGFPFGANTSEAKAFETNDVVIRGAQEIDMVINIGALKSGHLELVQEDIEGVVAAARKNDVTVKVIIETCYLTDDEKRTACRLSERAGADFIKTSTGFGVGGATIEDVRLLRSLVSPRLGVKASGGIRTAEQVLAMLEAGASRIGTSAGVKIMEEYIAKIGEK